MLSRSNDACIQDLIDIRTSSALPGLETSNSIKTTADLADLSAKLSECYFVAEASKSI
jgi:hypothetical protein